MKVGLSQAKIGPLSLVGVATNRRQFRFCARKMMDRIDSFAIVSVVAVTLTIDATCVAQSEPPQTVPSPRADASRAPYIADQIIVTGTRLRRPDLSAPSPVASFGKEQLDQAAEITIEDFLNELPQLTPGRGRSTIFGGDGTATLNLRGLGPNRTLTLLNGRRMAPSASSDGLAFATRPNINVIPALLVERVDIVTGGASAVYGSDAVAGAVNFILRDDFSGLELNGQFDVYGAGDGETYAINAAYGASFDGGRGQVTLFADYTRRTELLGADREFTDTLIREDFFTGELQETGSFISEAGTFFSPQVFIDGGQGFGTFSQDGTLRLSTDNDTFNSAQELSLQTGLERWSAGGFAKYEIAPDTELFAEFIYADTRSDLQFASSNPQAFISFAIDSDFFPDATRSDLSANFDPDGDGIGQGFFAKRLTEIGPRRTPRSEEYLYTVIGLQRQINEWSVNGYYSFGQSDQRFRLSNGIVRSRYLQAILTDPVTGQCVDTSNGCEPANVFGAGNLSDGAAQFITAPDFFTGARSRQHVANLSADGPLFSWSEGTALFAAGAEFRSNFTGFFADPVLS
ncbi:MAG: TonB-dependent receptor plug domain-containing protein, partial [Pseudomonadota bacterium]